MGNHSNILAWKIPQTKKPGELESIEVSKSQMQPSTHTNLHTAYWYNCCTNLLYLLTAFLWSNVKLLWYI